MNKTPIWSQIPWSDNDEFKRYYENISLIYPHFNISEVNNIRVKNYKLLFQYKGNMYSCELDTESIFHLIMKNIKTSVWFVVNFEKNRENIDSILTDYLPQSQIHKITHLYFSNKYYICHTPETIFMVPSFSKQNLITSNLQYSEAINLWDVIKEGFPDVCLQEVKNISLDYEWYMVFMVWDMQHFLSLTPLSTIQQEILTSKERSNFNKE